MSRFEEDNSIMKHHLGVLKKYPFVGLGFGAGFGVLLGRIIHFWKFRKSKVGREMYILETRIYTQGTIVIIVALPVIYDMLVFYYKKICGIPVVKEFKPLPKDLEYIPGKGPKGIGKKAE